METIRAFQIPFAAGSGNIGDELMVRAFWRRLPASISLDVALLPEHPRQHEPYPYRHRYVPVDWSNPECGAGSAPALLVGGTPVAEAEGLHFPLGFLGPRLESFHSHGRPVDAAGVGVDPLHTAEAIEIFRRCYLPIRSWTVRSENCRHALLELGVPEERVRVGADWGWDYKPRRNCRDWAENRWKSLGVTPDRPLLVANTVNMVWRNEARQRAIAWALDQSAKHFGLQIAFFANESREGEFFDSAAAAQVRSWMRSPAVIVPNEYYSPDEAIALLSCAEVTVSERYHFSVESVLAGTLPVNIVRGAKMRTLLEELRLPGYGTVESVDGDELLAGIRATFERRQDLLRQKKQIRAALFGRTARNTCFLKKLKPYSDSDWPG